MTKHLVALCALTLCGLANASMVVTGFAGQGVDHDLLEIPGRLVSLDREGSFLKGFAVAHDAAGADARVRWHGEVFLGDHTGLQRLTEASLTGGVMVLPLPSTAPWLELRCGIGLSHAFGTPTYEDGPRDDPGRRYRTQLGLVIDLTGRPSGWAGWGIGFRVHHRSGAYGLIAPRRVGSNFVGLTVSRRL